METIKPYVGEALVETIRKKIKMKEAVTNFTFSIKDNPIVKQQNLSFQKSDLTDADINIEKINLEIPEVPYQVLVLATNNWDENNSLGRGGFGTVFKGCWKNTTVAIKRNNSKFQMNQSLNELQFLNACRHENILGLYGYCLTGDTPCLVYQFMPNGTVEQHLYHQEKTLEWDQKCFIALGTARGLHFLHTFRDKPLIHGDIKPDNILLDYNFKPMIGDFGFARETSSQAMEEISKVYGTEPYLPYDFIVTRKVSTKVDIYSFGIVLYELATRKKVFVSDRTPEHLIFLMRRLFEGKIEQEKVIDLAHKYDPRGIKIFTELTELGKDCTSFKAENRPEIVEVLNNLEILYEQVKYLSL